MDSLCWENGLNERIQLEIHEDRVTWSAFVFELTITSKNASLAATFSADNQPYCKHTHIQHEHKNMKRFERLIHQARIVLCFSHASLFRHNFVSNFTKVVAARRSEYDTETVRLTAVQASRASATVWHDQQNFSDYCAPFTFVLPLPSPTKCMLSHCTSSRWSCGIRVKPSSHLGLPASGDTRWQAPLKTFVFPTRWDLHSTRHCQQSVHNTHRKHSWIGWTNAECYFYFWLCPSVLHFKYHTHCIINLWAM